MLPQAFFFRSTKLFFCLVLMAGLVFSAAKAIARGEAPGLANIDRVESAVRREWGPTVRRSDSSAWNNLLNRIVRDFTVQERASTHADTLVVNEIRIVESGIQNAFVVSLQSQGVNAQRNLIYVTTGMLQKLFPPNELASFSREELQRRVKMLSGLVAHEMGHPVDMIDGDFSLEKIGKLGSFSHAIEGRADYEGTELLRRAGYPEDAIQELKEFFFRSSRRQGTAVGSALERFRSTHPEENVNLTFLRVMGLFQRMRRGLRPETDFERLVSGLNTESLAREIQAMPQIRVDGFREAATLDEALEVMHKLLDNHWAVTKREESTRLRFNNHLLDLDRHLLALQEAGGSPSAAQREKLRGIFGRIAKLQVDFAKENSNPRSLLLTAEELAESSPEAFARLGRSHREFAAQIQWFRETEFTDLLRNAYPANLGENEYTVWSYLMWLGEEDSAVKALREHLAKEFANFRTDSPIAQSLSWLNWNDEFLSERTVRSIELDIAEQAVIRGSFEDQMNFVLNYSPGRRPLAPAFPRQRVAIESRRSDPAVTDAFLREISAPENAAEFTRLKQVYQRIWQDRGFYRFTEEFNNAPVEWNLIYRVLGLDRAQAERELEASLFRFIAEDERFGRSLWHLSRTQDWVRHTRGSVTDFDRRIYQAAEARLRTLQATEARLAEDGLVQIRRLFVSPDAAEVERRFREALRLRLAQASTARQKVTPVEFAAMLKDIAANELRGLVPATPHYQVWAEEISQSALPAADKTELLRQVFLRYPGMHQTKFMLPYKTATVFGSVSSRETADHLTRVSRELGISLGDPLERFSYNWVTSGSPDPQRVRSAVLAVLQRHDLVEKPSDILVAWRSLYQPFFGEERVASTYAEEHGKLLAHLVPEIEAEARGIAQSTLSPGAKTAALRELTARTLDPIGRAFDPKTSAWAFERSLQAILETAKSVELPYQDALDLFIRATNFGRSLGADDFFTAQILPRIPAPREPFLRRMLTEKRILSEAAQVRYAEQVLSPIVRRFQRTGTTQERLLALLLELEKLVPNASYQRDELIEGWAWSLHIDDAARLNFIESYKSTNLRRVDFAKTRWLSALSDYVGNFSQEARMDLFSYIAHPQGKPFPASAEAELTRLVREDLASRREFHGLQLEGQVQNRLIQIRGNIVSAVRDSSAYEKVPALDLLLNIGNDPIAARPDFPRNITATLLNIEPNSNNERALFAFLDPRVTPPKQKTAVIAYLASIQDGQGRPSVTHVFNAFGSPGYRASQDALTWRLLPRAYDADLARNYDSAEPEPKARLARFLRERYPNREFRLTERLGSASTVTVVDVEWDEVDAAGNKVTRSAAALVRRENAIEQINAHIASGKAYLQVLEEQGMKAEATFVRQLIEAQEAQMRRELDMRIVGDNIRKLAEMVDGEGLDGSNLNAVMRMRERGWQFRVPRVLDGPNEFGRHEDILFMERAGGTTFRKADEAARQASGAIIAEAQARTTFAGAYQANPHGGNFMVDYQPGRQLNTIWFIDGGQVGTMREVLPDGRRADYAFAQLLRALFEKNPRAVTQYGTELASVVSPSLSRPALELAITKVLQEETNPANLLPKLVNTFTEHGVYLNPQYIFTGGLKSLVDALRAGYVDPTQFQEIVGREVTRVLSRNPGSVVADAYQQRGLRCFVDFAKIAGQAIRRRVSVNPGRIPPSGAGAPALAR